MTTAPELTAEVPGGAAAPAPAAIELTAVTVRFRIPNDRIGSFKEYVIRRFTGGLGYRDLWALREVDLAVPAGEVLGIVGRNGAGKSTLLKTIARVLRPTGGRVVVRGRVAPLLELGAGFHPDLTGAENVYLNGTLLGHSRRFLQENFAAIVAFAELADFVNLPIRNYSNGMLARLGFAVATVTRPDVLILDEVLAVGDNRFQDKCLQRIGEFRAGGTTVLLVSHSLEEVARHCDRALWLERGTIRAQGATPEVLQRYRRALELPVAGRPAADDPR